jgi:uncharacterized protein YggE
MKYFFTAILVFAGVTAIMAQHSGNVVYGEASPLRAHPFVEKAYLTDSTFVVGASVLMNVIADGYVATFGVADSAGTVQQCNARIDKRIAGFTAALAKMNISSDDYYVDMTTQSKILDYHIKGNVAEQYLKGFEIKKNVAIKFSNIETLNNLVLAASGFEIYDLVKVDYIVNDLNKVHMQLFKLAAELINEKKDMYTSATNAKVLPVSQIYNDDFASYYPTQLYKKYAAENSSRIYTEYDRMIKKDLKNSITVYYDKINYSGFDKIINPAVIEPAIEFVINLQIKFQLQKPNGK